LKRAWLSWSGGKDCAWAFHRARGEFDIAGLLVTISETVPMVPIHNTPAALIRAQAAALGLPALEIPLPQPCPNREYAARVRAALSKAAIDTLIFGDLYLADIRAFREELLAPTGIEPLFPLWGERTGLLAREMIAGGLEATVCASSDPALIGRAFDEDFLAALPPTVDPCGENGEFHTFVNCMPEFRYRVPS